MPYHRRARRDDNHGAITKAFEALGCSVTDLSQSPTGFDILVGFGLTAGPANISMPVEIKNPARPKHRRKLTPNEQRIHDGWKGCKAIVETCEDVAEVVNRMRRMRTALLMSGYA